MKMTMTSENLRPTIRLGFKLETILVATLALVVMLNSLDSFAVAGVPITWIGQVFVVGALGVLLAVRAVPIMPGTGTFLLLLLWLVFVTVVGAVSGDYAARMPPAATSYPFYLLLRFLNIVSVMAVAYLAFWLASLAGVEFASRIVAVVASVVAGYAIYAYVGNVVGLPVVVGNRIGTGGEGEIANVFYGGIYRTLGTFREPGDIARWLLVPFFLSLVVGRGRINIPAMIIGLALLLSLSLTAYASIAIGFAIVLMMGNFLGARSLKLIARIVIGLGLVLAAAYFGFDAIGFTTNVLSGLGQTAPEGGVNFLEFTFNRVVDILELGASGSNRVHIFAYMQSAPIPILGMGLGNANIDLSGPKIDAFLSLFVNFWYSGGPVGMLLLAVFLLAPLFRVPAQTLIANPRVSWVVGGYVAWFGPFIGSSEEMNIMFGIAFGILAAIIADGLRSLPRHAFAHH